MGWFARPPEPAPLAPRHRRVWRGLRRRCSCGLQWKTCPDRHATVPTEPRADPRHRNRPAWADATVANPQVGRAGRLTPAQSWRVALCVYLCAMLHEAVADLYRLNPNDAPDLPALFDRFIGWAPRRSA